MNVKINKKAGVPVKRRVRRHHPLLWMFERLNSRIVRLFFSTGRIVELRITTTENAKITAAGMGFDPRGDGRDRCVLEMHKREDGKVWREGHWT